MSRTQALFRIAVSQALLVTLALGQNAGSGQKTPDSNVPPAGPAQNTPAGEQQTAKKTDNKTATDKQDTAKDSGAATGTVTGPWHVSVEAVAGDQLSLDVLALYPRTDIGGSPKTIPGTACTTQDLPCKRLHLVVADSVVKDQLKLLHQGDHIQVVYSSDIAKNQNTLKALSVDSLKTEARSVALVGSTIACFFLYCMFSGFKPLQLIISEDNRYSNSRFQMAIWFFVLITSYIATFLLRVWTGGGDFIGGVDIPKNLLLLSGMSVLTFGGAKAITTAKINQAQQAGASGNPPVTPNQPPSGTDAQSSAGVRSDAPPPKTDATAANTSPADPAKVAPGNSNVKVISPDLMQSQGFTQSNNPSGVQPPAAVVGTSRNPKNPKKKGEQSFFADLVNDDYGQFDFGDFQMLIVTLIAVGTYVVLIFNFMGAVEYSKVISLPEVDTTLLAAFGLGQGAYLTKKAVGDPGKS